LGTPRIVYKSVSLITEWMKLSSQVAVDEGAGAPDGEVVETEEDGEPRVFDEDEDESDDKGVVDIEGEDGEEEAGVSSGLVTSLVGSATQVKYFRS
jgi:hypothetical protein